jgi:hypothetical protein
MTLFEKFPKRQHNNAMQRRPVSVFTAFEINRPARADRERSSKDQQRNISPFGPTPPICGRPSWMACSSA